MAINSTIIEAEPSRIQEVLDDPRHFAYWIVGTKEIRHVEPSWPAPGSAFHHSVGAGVFRLRDRTVLLDREPGVFMELDVHIDPFMRAHVSIELEAGPEGTLVTMRERISGGLLGLAAPLAETALGARNLESLARLKALVEARGAVDSPSLRTELGGSSIFQAPEVTRFVDEAGEAYLAVRTAQDVHVTPHLFALGSDRFWLVVPRTSLKAKMTLKRPAIGLSIRSGRRYLALQGEAVVLDPLDPSSLLASESLGYPRASLSYARRNSRELLSWLGELPGLLGEPSRAHRVALAVRPRWAVLGDDDAILGSYGVLPQATSPGSASSDLPDEPDPLEANDLPHDLDRMANNPADGVLGWTNEAGPLALPCRWDPEKARARVSEELLRISGALEESPACVTLARSRGPGPESKSGVIIRGRGHLDAEDEGAIAFLDPERISTWSGQESTTADTR